MIQGKHLAIGGAIVLMPDGSPRLQLWSGDNWVHIALHPLAANQIRKRLGIPFLVAEPTFTGTEEPLKTPPQFKRCSDIKDG